MLLKFPLAISAVLVSMSLSACTAESPQNDKTLDYLEEIYRLTEEKRCVEDSDCQVAAVGAAPCGGPEEYRVYSNLELKNTSNEDTLDFYLEQFKSQRQQENAERQIMGICRQLDKPTAQCRNQQCVASKALTQ